MKPTSKNIIAGLVLSTALAGGADAAVLNEVPIQGSVTVASEVVDVRQVENEVQATLPWKGERGLTLRKDLGVPTVAERMADKRKHEAVVDVSTFGEGGIKFDILLNEKPDTNRFCYQVDGWEDYNWYYQPELTAEEIAEGAHRPENIVGSYAVYHTTLKNHRIGGENYATGKAFHIERPSVWEVNDKEATKEWAELSFNEGELCVTARQGFLDSAEYPVRIDPTVGYTSIGASAYNLNNPTLVIRRGSATVSTIEGTIDSMHAVFLTCEICGGGDVTQNVAVSVLVEDGAGSGSHTEVLNIEESKNITITPAFETFTAAGESITSDTYVFAAIASTYTNNNIQGRYDSSGSRNQYIETIAGASYTTLRDENPWTETASTDSLLLSIYATYSTGGGGGAPPNPPQSFIFD